MKLRRGQAKGDRKEKEKSPDLDYFIENPCYFVKDTSLTFFINLNCESLNGR